MKKILNTLSVVVLLTSACAKHSSHTESFDSSVVATDGNKKLSDDSLLGSYTVEKFTAKTLDGDFQVTFPGLIETREIARDSNGGLIIKQKSALDGCTREIVSNLDYSMEAGVYTRSKFTSENCTGSCPAKVTGYFQGYQLQDPSFDLACGKTDDKAESGTVRLENDRLVFEVNEDYGFSETLLRN